jgi:hypothetical protein
LALVLVDEFFDVNEVDQHLSSNLDESKPTLPDLTAPEPLGTTDLSGQLLNGKQPFSGHSLGTSVRIHLFYLLSLRPHG